MYATGDGARHLIAGLDEFDHTGPNESSIQDGFTVDKRFHLIPAASLLITIPFSNDRLVVHRLDIGKALDQLADDRLVVTSSPIQDTESGKAIEQQIEARSKAGGLKYTLVSGPNGLTVSPTGRLSWPSPRLQSVGDVVKAVVAIKDSSGQQYSHAITIRIH